MPDFETDGKGKIDYGVDAPAVLRNLFLIGFACLIAGMLLPPVLHLGNHIRIDSRPAFFWPAGFLLTEACLFLLYVKVGKFRHRDMMLGLYRWRGDEQVLDVGCGRGLLLAEAAKRLNNGGHATGIDIWSTTDMGGNAVGATEHNLVMEGIKERCTLVSLPAQQMPFADASFDVIVSNLCLHNIYDKSMRMQALDQIMRVLKPGGIALLSDYKRTGEYKAHLRTAGLSVTSKRGSFFTTFPPLNVVIARKQT